MPIVLITGNIFVLVFSVLRTFVTTMIWHRFCMEYVYTYACVCVCVYLPALYVTAWVL
jgi:hypothetical protein